MKEKWGGDELEVVSGLLPLRGSGGCAESGFETRYVGRIGAVGSLA